MSASILSTNVNIQGLGNLLAPADGVTHAAIFSATMNNSSVSISMPSLFSYLGWNFQPQAMTIDNLGGGSSVVVKGTYSQFTEIVPAGIKRTFQFPSVADEIFTYTSTGAVTCQVLLYDFPAFPDTNNSSPPGIGGPLDVTILGQPVLVEEQAVNLIYGAAANTTFAAGATGNVFNASTITNGCVIKNPSSNTGQFLVDPTGSAIGGTTEGGTVFGIDPGASVSFGPSAQAIVGKNPTGSSVDIVAYSF